MGRGQLLGSHVDTNQKACDSLCIFHVQPPVNVHPCQCAASEIGHMLAVKESKEQRQMKRTH